MRGSSEPFAPGLHHKVAHLPRRLAPLALGPGKHAVRGHEVAEVRVLPVLVLAGVLADGGVVQRGVLFQVVHDLVHALRLVAEDEHHGPGLHRGLDEHGALAAAARRHDEPVLSRRLADGHHHALLRLALHIERRAVLEEKPGELQHVATQKPRYRSAPSRRGVQKCARAPHTSRKAALARTRLLPLPQLPRGCSPSRNPSVASPTAITRRAPRAPRAPSPCPAARRSAAPLA
jgi:hypothetical protein